MRAPRMPVELHRAMTASTSRDDALDTLPGSLLPADARVRAAIAVGSRSLFERLRATSPESDDAAELRRKLARYVVRMCSRATPFGMFAGVGQARWGDATDLAVDPTTARTRTRPDMEWLAVRLAALESRIEARRHLTFMTNPTVFVHGGRFVISKQQLLGKGEGVGVSVKATGVVKRALELAREPIAYGDLASALASSPRATAEKVDTLLTQLWKNALLVTDLRPAPTAPDPVAWVLRRLEAVPAAAKLRAEIVELAEAAEAWDALPEDRRAEAFVALADDAASDLPRVKSRVQVDMAFGLRGTRILDEVGVDAARAAELLLRMTPSPGGLRYLAAYREDFLARYGLGREVPLLELLDPDCGLPYSLRRLDLSDEKRDPVVLGIATRALFERRTVVSLDEATLKELQTYELAAETAPLSLDVNVVVAAESRQGLDRGDYTLVVGAVMGAQSAGRVLGRFADLLPRGRDELRAAFRAEEALAPPGVWAELVDVPPDARGTNVVIRPAVAAYEIQVGASPSVPRKNVIPLRELVVGVRDDRFYVRWPRRNVDVFVRTGHMLNPTTSASVAQFLGDVSRDGRAVFTGFPWGPAKSFPFLPRVEVGRIVLSLAQWRLDVAEARRELRAASPAHFADAFTQWRLAWKVPRHVHFGDLDHRLLLDLDHPAHVEELRREVLRRAADEHVEIQEGYPGIDGAWLEGEDGHYVCELAVSLVQDAAKVQAAVPAPARAKEPPPPAVVRRPPGTEWLFLKLYAAKLHEEDLIASHVRKLARHAIERGLAEEWFFVRYADPERHVRLRFRGDAQRMLTELAPATFAWLDALMEEGTCTRFAIDTYDREVERYGGVDAMRVAESMFAVDSEAVADLIDAAQRAPSLDRSDLAIATVTDMLDAMGLDARGRLAWLEGIGLTRSRADCGGEYRLRRERLLALLREPGARSSAFGAEVADVLARRRERLRPLGRELAALEARGLSSEAPSAIFRSQVHMHMNRLFGIDPDAERRMYGLLLRAHESLAHAPSSSAPSSGVTPIAHQERTLR